MCDIMETGEKRNTLPMGGDFQFFVVCFFFPQNWMGMLLL